MNPATTNQKKMANGQSLNFGFSILKLSSKFSAGTGFHSNLRTADALNPGELDTVGPVVAVHIGVYLVVGNWVEGNHS